ncbi:MAG: O-antigen ligase family protein [Flavobacteriales bacterium]|nr:O-antigen ligase family protein [Flavobacteriales bacterium]
MIVILYTIINHASYGFEDKPAHWVMQPFMKDHTSYGALIAFFIPFTFIQAFRNSSRNLWLRIGICTVLFVFIVGLIFSYTRAAWVSVVVAIVSWVLIEFKVKVRNLMLMGFGVLVVLFSFQNEILQKLEKNKQDSSEDFAEHVQSISNVASDASNLERLNRWSCAIKMFAEKPILGWGPGTYMFEYAPFQESGDLTIISTNFGDMGNAHSEYLGPLSESGFLGMLTFISLVVIILYRGIRLYYRLSGPLKYQMLSIVLGLITYLAHGFLNNFLDTDKASIPFWGFAAMIVAIDLYHKDGTTIASMKSTTE